VPPSVVGMQITQAPGLRNIKTASGKISPRCFRWLLHKRHANPTRELVSGAEQADRLSKIAIWNLLLAARAALGHIRPQWSCGRVAEGGGLLNRYRVVKPYRGFESLRLRQNAPMKMMGMDRAEMR
jgi:hypothetical protein